MKDLDFLGELLFFWETAKMAWRYWAKDSFFFFVITYPHEKESSPWTTYQSAYQMTAIYYVSDAQSSFPRQLLGDNWRGDIKKTSLKGLMVQYPYLKSTAAKRYAEIMKSSLQNT